MINSRGIQENLIEIKTFVSPHSLDDVLKVSKAIEAMPPGKVAVLCDPDVTEMNGLLVSHGRWIGSQNSDTGIVVSSGTKSLKPGQRVCFLPLHGLRCSAPEFNWVAEGMEVRLYGVSCPWYDSILGVLEND